MVNMVPQSPKLNQQNWRKLESNIQFMILNHGDAYILTGSKPSVNNFIANKSSKYINISDKLFKVFVIDNKYCACVVDNKDSGIVTKTTINEIEKDFNLKLFNVTLSKNSFC